MNFTTNTLGATAHRDNVQSALTAQMIKAIE